MEKTLERYNLNPTLTSPTPDKKTGTPKSENKKTDAKGKFSGSAGTAEKKKRKSGGADMDVDVGETPIVKKKKKKSLVEK